MNHPLGGLIVPPNEGELLESHCDSCFVKKNADININNRFSTQRLLYGSKYGYINTDIDGRNIDGDERNTHKGSTVISKAPR